MTIATTDRSDTEIVSTWSYGEAREWVTRVRVTLDEARTLIIDGVRNQVWVGLGYESWGEMCSREFDGAIIRLPRVDRPAFVAELRAAGMSTRAIGAALGVDQKTIVNDRRHSGEENSSPGDPPPPVTGTDGKIYNGARAKPKAPDLEPSTTAGPQVAPEPEPEHAPTAPVEASPVEPAPTVEVTAQPSTSAAVLPWIDDMFEVVFKVVDPNLHAGVREHVAEHVLTAVLDSLHEDDRKIVYRTLSRKMHPDMGGSVESMRALSAAMRNCEI
ncbi:hypothetical protein [Parafrankia sp. EUN1f]|uniref:hypothetical protein n=1 Tax=Parafrankia sp. EUN1f TaxID=102897 RepID=UPI0001C4556B|nr:hypothetical protein [Parafrankia sp. EUN1f]EFC86450.1 hypothetical protein FrEUN1fDRAFT_0345 [Parafrankia sp. EUN1f]